jgi:hypothetical protein
MWQGMEAVVVPGGDVVEWDLCETSTVARSKPLNKEQVHKISAVKDDGALPPEVRGRVRMVLNKHAPVATATGPLLSLAGDEMAQAAPCFRAVVYNDICT